MIIWKNVDEMIHLGPMNTIQLYDKTKEKFMQLHKLTSQM